MGRASSRDLRDRVIAAVEGVVPVGFQAVRRQGGERDPAATAGAAAWRAGRQAAGRRSSNAQDRGACILILGAIEQQPDLTLAE